MRPRELRPGETQSQTERDVYSPLTGPFSLWGAMNVNRIQPTGVERAGQVEERVEGTGRENSGLKSYKTSGLF